jgi:hypothetical protein
VDAETVRDKARRVAGDDHALAQHALGEARDALQNVGVGLAAGDKLQQFQVARRVEKVRAQEASLDVVAAIVAHFVNRQPACVSGQHGVRGDIVLHARPQRAFDVGLLDDGFNHPVRFLQAGKISFKTS